MPDELLIDGWVGCDPVDHPETEEGGKTKKQYIYFRHRTQDEGRARLGEDSRVRPARRHHR